MDFEYDGKILRFDKILSDLDLQVIEFVKLLEKAKIHYVIISGYVAILLARSRTTEDVDIFIDKIGFKQFSGFFDLLMAAGYWLIDSDSKEDAFDRLQDSLSIRAAKKDEVVPNFEIKFPKKKTDFTSLSSPIQALVNNKKLLISPFEVQLPFKVWLGSDKDIEDAVHLYELFKEKLNRKTMSDVAKELKVEKKMVKYGIT